MYREISWYHQIHIEWVNIGPRFSNIVLQTLLILLKKQPPKNRRLLVICTSSYRHVLQQMDMLEAFTSELYCPPLYDISTISIVLKEVKLFEQVELNVFLTQLQQQGVPEHFQVDNKFSIGIKKFMQLTETARQSIDKVSTLTDTVMRASRDL